MSTKMGRMICLPGYLLIFSAFFLNSGCWSKKGETTKTVRSLPINKVVAVCFLSALEQGKEPGMVTNPISGSLVSAEPVPDSVILKMSDTLFEKVSAEKSYELVSRGQAMGVYSSIVASDQNVGMPAIHVLQIIGQTFKADAVLVGYVYRWKERVGSSLSAESAASASFDLQLLRPLDGKILWKAKFDKTQQSFTENLLEVGTFIKGGGKWMTVEQLAMIGLQKMIDEMPVGEKQ